jgi:hypothetical protein
MEKKNTCPFLHMQSSELKWLKKVTTRWNIPFEFPLEAGIFLFSTLPIGQTCPCAHAGREQSIVLLEGSQASPICPYDKNRLKAKTLEWLEAVA